MHQLTQRRGVRPALVKQALAIVMLAVASGCGSDSSTGSTSGLNISSIQLKLPTITLDAIGATKNDTAIALDASGQEVSGAPITWTTSSSVVSLALATAVGGIDVKSGPGLARAVAPVTGLAVVIIA